MSRPTASLIHLLLLKHFPVNFPAGHLSIRIFLFVFRLSCSVTQITESSTCALKFLGKALGCVKGFSEDSFSLTDQVSTEQLKSTRTFLGIFSLICSKRKIKCVTGGVFRNMSSDQCLKSSTENLNVIVDI